MVNTAGMLPLLVQYCLIILALSVHVPVIKIIILASSPIGYRAPRSAISPCFLSLRNLRELQGNLSYDSCCCFCFYGSLVILFVLVFNLEFLQGYLSICPDIGLDHQSTKVLLQCCRIKPLSFGQTLFI